MSTRRAFVKNAGGAAVAAAAGRAGQAPSDKKIRLAVVGGGFGANFHWHEHPRCTVTAVTDLHAVRRDRLRKAYRCDSVYDSLDELLKKRRDLDAVAIFSGAPDHVRQTKLCMERGLHVISAVPACTSLEDAEQLRAVKEKTGLHYMMAESSWYRQAVIYARDLYKKGGFGAIQYSEVEYYHDFNFDDRLKLKNSLYYNPDGSNSWRQNFPPMLYPTHSLGFVAGVTGERIATVACLGAGDRARMALVPTNVYRNPFFNEFALMRTSKGNAVRHNECRQIAAAESERAQWFGEKGTLYMAKPGLHPDTWHPRYGKSQPVQIPNYWEGDVLPPAMRHSSGHGGSAVFLCNEFIDALVENREPVIDVYESLAMTVPGLIAHQSALKNGESLKVPSFDRKG